MSETLILPPFVDGHVHLREPGTNPAETIYNGTKAAALGGVGMVADMSNNAPQPTSTAEAMQTKHRIIQRDACVHVGTAAGAQPEYDNLGELDKMLPRSVFVKLYGGKTTNIDRDTDYEAADFDEALDRIKAIDPTTLIVFHSGDSNYQDFIGHAAGDRGLPVRLAHVSKLDQVTAVLQAQAKGWDVHSAVCPHTLLLPSSEVRTKSTFADMQPPLVHQTDMELLMAAFARGDIQALETDHAPHPYKTKMDAAIDNPLCDEHGARCCGVPGLEFAGPLLLYQAKIGTITVERLVEAYSTIPAASMGLRHDFYSHVEWDMTEYRIEDEDQVVSACGWTPYLGMLAIGKVLHMRLGDHDVVQQGRVYEIKRQVVTGAGEEI